MSALMILKNVTMTLMKPEVPKSLRSGLINVFNAIEGDLDIYGYGQSSEVDKALIELDKALVSFDEPAEDSKQEEQITIKTIKDVTPPQGYRDSQSGL
jgi:hypothetical protein